MLFFRKIIIISFLAFFGVCLFGAPVNALVCDCSCGESGSSIGNYYDLTACNAKCKEGASDSYGKCEWLPGSISSLCMSEAQCSTQGGRGWSANSECGVSDMGYCYVPELNLPLNVNIGGLVEVDSLPQYISAIYNYMVGAGVVVAIVMIMWGGVRRIMSSAAGDVGEANKIISRAIIGLIILLGAFLILNTISPALTHLNLPGLKMVRENDYQYGVFRCEDYNLEVECQENRADLINQYTGDPWECTWDITYGCQRTSPPDGTSGGECKSGDECDAGLVAMTNSYYGLAPKENINSFKKIGCYCSNGSLDSPCKTETLRTIWSWSKEVSRAASYASVQGNIWRWITDKTKEDEGEGEELVVCDTYNLNCDPLTRSCQSWNKKPQGAECSQNTECASGFCNDLGTDTFCDFNASSSLDWPWPACTGGASCSGTANCSSKSATSGNKELCCESSSAARPAISTTYLVEDDITGQCHYECTDIYSCSDDSYCWTGQHEITFMNTATADTRNMTGISNLTGRCFARGNTGDKCFAINYNSECINGPCSAVGQTTISSSDYIGYVNLSAGDFPEVLVGVCP